MNGFDPFGLGPDADTDFLGPPPWDEDPPPPRKPNNPEGINQHTMSIGIPSRSISTGENDA